MTMVSHKYKFIFIKPGKVAGSSVLQALGKQAGPEDIVVSPINTEGLGRYERNNLNMRYSPERTTNEKDRLLVREAVGENHERASMWPIARILSEHMKSWDIKEAVGEEVWNTYCKITIVRNPWDRLVSGYCWNDGMGVDGPGWNDITYFSSAEVLLGRHIVPTPMLGPKLWIGTSPIPTLFIDSAKPLKFERLPAPDLSNPLFLSRFRHHIEKAAGTNEEYYFNKDGTPAADFYMRYESIEKDYQHICKQLGIPIEPLPTLKKRATKFKNPYWEYYDQEMRQFVAEKCARTIEHFGYKFENDKSY